ncbi:MAG: hypothetical protein Q4G67_13715 [Actinomycetia bacterium]|nr:hypothetical protein [Actinomycetes bacterium]
MAEELLQVLRRGDLAETVALLREDPGAAGRDRVAIKRLRDELLEASGGARSPSWAGVAENVRDAVDLAYLVALPPERAARLGAVTRPAADALALVVPEDLPVFVEEWSAIFQRNPKNWDRIWHYAAMFFWVVDGHVPAPTQDGAVNLWLQHAVQLVRPHAPPGRGEPNRRPHPTPDDCPSLYTVTLPLLFSAQVRPGLGAAAIDRTAGDAVIELVEHLVNTGVWTREETLDRIATALTSPDRASPFQQRWLHRLEARLA